MSGREQLIRDWRDRLAQSEAELECASPNRRWIKRIYVRLYRFLLAMYGRGDWTADDTLSLTDGTETPDDDSHQSHMELIDLRTEIGGAPPKSVAQIRQTLKTVHAAAEPTEQIGPHAKGLQPEDWIVAASQRDGVVLQRFAEALNLAGVPCRRRRLGRDTVVEVRLFHQEEASELLKNLGSRVGESPQQIRYELASRRLVRILTGLFMGGLLPFLAFATFHFYCDTPPADDQLPTVVIGMLVGAVCGGIVCSEIARRRK
jgi:hypothetical protein